MREWFIVGNRYGSLVKPELWNDVDGRNGFILSMVSSSEGRRSFAAETSPALWGGRPKSFTEAVKTPSHLMNPADKKKSSIAVKSSTNDVRMFADAKSSADAKRVCQCYEVRQC